MKLTIYWKMMLGFSAIIFVMVAANTYMLYELNDVAARARTTLHDDVRSIDLAKQVNAMVLDEEHYAQKYAISRDTAYFGLLLESGRFVSSAFDSLTEFPSDTLSLHAARNAETLHAAFINNASRVPDSLTTEQLDGLRDALDRLIYLKQSKVSYSMSAVEKSALRASGVALILLVISFFVALVLALAITRTITRPISTLVRGTEQVARGSFEPIEVSSRDEIARLAASFNAMSSTLKSVNRYRAEMMQHISHELRMPLQTMHSAYYLLMEGGRGEMNAEQRRLLDSMRENIDKIAKFSNQFLDLSRLEAGMMEFSFAESDIAEILSPVVRDAHIMASRKNIALIFRPEPAPRVMADAEKCAQIFSNIIGNAIKYTDDGGTVNITVAPGPGGTRVAVADTGAGIPQAEIANVFTKFYRSSNAVKTRSKGTGIGLALVKALAEGHGGRVGVTSTLGTGSTFTVDFPKAAAGQKGES